MSPSRSVKTPQVQIKYKTTIYEARWLYVRIHYPTKITALNAQVVLREKTELNRKNKKKGTENVFVHGFNFNLAFVQQLCIGLYIYQRL